MPVSVTYDELRRVAAMLDEFAADAHKQTGNFDRTLVGKKMVFEEAIAYEIVAKRLRNVQLTAPAVVERLVRKYAGEQADGDTGTESNKAAEE